MARKVYRELAVAIDAMQTCQNRTKAGGTDSGWGESWREYIETICREMLPSGGGWNSGTKMDFDASQGEKLVLYGSFHHMDENGCYDGWTDHRVTVYPSMIHRISLAISGRNRNDIKDYLYDRFRCALEADMPDSIQPKRPEAV